MQMPPFMVTWPSLKQSFATLSQNQHKVFWLLVYCI